MSVNLRLAVIIVSLLLFIIVISILKKDRIPIKYSLIWIFSSLFILLIGAIPNIIGIVSSVMGFVTMSNMVIGIFIFILLMITIILTIIVSGQKKKITLLIQEVSILKEKVNKNEK